MTSSLAPPPRDTRGREAAPARLERRRPAISAPRPRRRSFAGGPLSLSVLVHLVGIGSLALLARFGPSAGAASDAEVWEVVEYLDIPFPSGAAPTGAAAPDAPPAPVATESPVTAPRAARRDPERLVFPTRPRAGLPPVAEGAASGVGSDASAAVGGEAQGGAGGGGVGARLQPGFRDARLYVDQEAESLKKTDTRSDHQRYMEHLQARIQASNDSAWAEGSHPNTDWTTTDRKGRKWGVSEKGVHLGGVTIPKQVIPLPRATGSNQKLEEAREKERQRKEIRAQEEDRQRRRTRAERAKATRDREDQQRKKEKGGGGE